jgi:hypothetical protein
MFGFSRNDLAKAIIFFLLLSFQLKLEAIHKVKGNAKFIKPEVMQNTSISQRQFAGDLWS